MRDFGWAVRRLEPARQESVHSHAAEWLIWSIVAAALLFWRLYAGVAPTMGQDSFQYLSVASNALEGRIGYTSLVHFDAERSMGVIPAPMVTFPSGYPMAIALINAAGISLPLAGLLISAAAVLACIPLLAWIGAGVGLTRPLRHAVLAGFALNSAVLASGSFVASDALFSLAALTGVGLLVHARASNATASGGWIAIAAGVAFGMACLVRYAGMFFVIGLALVVLRHLVAGRLSAATQTAIAFVTSGLFVAVGIARNIALVGNWRGGNDKVVSNPIGSVVLETVRGANRLLLGPGSGAAGGTFAIRAALALLLVAGLGWMVVTWLRRRPAPARGPAASPAAKYLGGDMAILAIVYLACLFYAGLKSVIDYGDARYFVPILPLVWLLLALLVRALVPAASPSQRNWPVVALLASLCLYAMLNLLVLRNSERARWADIARQIDAVTADGKSVRDAVRELTATRGVVMANQGQTIGHLLARPTLSLVGPHYSHVVWNEDAMRAAARKFGIKAVVIYAPETAEQWDDDDIVPSTFVRGLARGEAPEWLHLVRRSGRLLVYAPRLGD